MTHPAQPPPTREQFELLEQLKRDAYPRLSVEERDALASVLAYARLGVGLARDPTDLAWRYADKHGLSDQVVPHLSGFLATAVRLGLLAPQGAGKRSS